MPDHYTLDLRHYLDENGDLSPLPVPAMTIAIFCGAVVACVSGWQGTRWYRSQG